MYLQKLKKVKKATHKFNMIKINCSSPNKIWDLPLTKRKLKKDYFISKNFFKSLKSCI